jgi:hypothetical protein
MSRARKAVRRKPGPQRLLLAVVIALAIALLLLRLIVSLHPHRRREFRTGNPQPGAFEASLILASSHPPGLDKFPVDIDRVIQVQQ